MRHRLLALVLPAVLSLAVLALAGCSPPPVSDDTIAGTISEVSGDGAVVAGFVITAEDGSSHRFVPSAGLRAEEGVLSRLREHVVTGEPVIVQFERGPEGGLVALRVDGR